MAADGWRYVKADEHTDEGIDALIEKLSETTGVRLTRGQVMSRALAVGVEDLTANPARFTTVAKKASK